uniref:RNA helicase n=5 Tax=Rhodnius TaxID=13248 RepID=T1HTF9_RHOPR
MENEDSDEAPSINFHEMELDDRLLKAIAKLGWASPTLIQEKAIPLMLEGKDLLIKARTGSGKTGAFMIPIIQQILTQKKISLKPQVRVLVMAPTKELCRQIHSHTLQLTIKCSQDCRVVDIAQQADVESARPLLTDLPDIVIGTPARAMSHLSNGSLVLNKSLTTLVVDEADLVFSFGYEDDVKQVLRHLPRVYQAVLASATLTDDVTSLKKLVLHNAVTLKLKDSDISVGQITHYKLYAEQDDKAALIYALLKLGLIKGKSIIFTNTVDKSYKIKLFLEQFGISSCALNSELPAAVRCHVVSQFNENKYDIIIASDEKVVTNPANSSEVQSSRNKDKESGVARGIDFQCVSNVINFDFPLDIKTYVHRAGRTARGKNKGSVLSFISVSEVQTLESVDEYLKEGLRIDTIFKDYKFKMEEIEGFRYRARDAWRATTKIAVKEARLKEIKQEIFNSKKLRGYFEDNPRDLKTLRHDKPLRTVKLPSHLANVPDYIIPQSLKAIPGLVKIHKVKKFKSASNVNKKYQV